MAAHRRKSKRLSETALNELTDLATRRAHSAIGLSTQLVEDGSQQYSLALAVIACLITIAASMVEGEDDPLDFTLKHIEKTLKTCREGQR